MSAKSAPVFSKFVSDQGDILILAIILAFTAIGIAAKNKIFLQVSLFWMIFNFMVIWIGSKKEKTDERVLHHQYFSSYVTVIVVFFVLVLMGLIYKFNIFREINMQTHTQLIAWILGFTYALSYSILKRVK